MKREKSFSEILRHKNFTIFYLFGFYILINKFQLTASLSKQANDDPFAINQIDKILVGRQTRQDDNEENLTCQYRDSEFSQEHFGIYATYGCYSFMRPDLKVNPLQILVCPSDSGVFLPALNISNNCNYKFSIEDPAVKKEVQKSFANSNVYNRWLSCSQDAIDCCEKHLLGKKFKDQYCSPVWDGWTCFSDYTRAGEDQEMICSKYAYSGTPPQCNHYGTKTCFDNATWNIQTNYSTCAISSRLVTRTQWHIAMLSISIIISFPGLLMLLVYKQLYSQKYFMIRNLIIAIMCRNLFVLLSKSTIIMDELTNTEASTIMSNNRAECRILTFFEKLAANFVFTCMVLEGIYLHQLLTNVFGTRRNAGVVKMLYYYIGGTFISISTALVWSILMAVLYDNNCWAVTDDNNLHWINDSPRLAMLLLNTILLGHIVIVMWKTFRSKSNEDSPGLRTAKASLICLPLFGVPFLFIIFRPATESCGWEQFYYFISYALEGLQCIFVVIFHCYLDREVQRLVKRSFNLLQETLNLGKNKKRKSKYEERRTTYSTYADSRPNNERPVISLPIPANQDNNSTPQTTQINSSIVCNNSQVESSQSGDVSNEPLYENVPPLYRQNIIITNEFPENPINATPTNDNNINNLNSFYVNDDHENIFDYYYKDDNSNTPPDYSVEPSMKSISQMNDSNKFKDDIKLDPKLFFKNRSNGIVFLDDENLY